MLQVQNFWKILEKGFLEFAKSATVTIQTLQAPAFQGDLNKKAIPKGSPAPKALPRRSPRSQVIQRLPSWPTELQRHRRTTQDYTQDTEDHTGYTGMHGTRRTTQDQAGTRGTLRLAAGSYPARGRSATPTPAAQPATPPSLGTAAPRSPRSPRSATPPCLGTAPHSPWCC